MKRGSLESDIKFAVGKFLEKSENREVGIISHFDTDGVTSAVIIMQALKRLDRKFSLRIIKRIEPDFLETLPKERLLVFLDLASGCLDEISKSGIKEVFIIDHHEITTEIPENVTIVNPELNEKEKISSSGLTYLFCMELDIKNKELAKLAALGMVGDLMERSIDKLNNEIVSDIKKKRGLMIYPSTRPLNKVLEYCSEPYIPGVTGEAAGVTELLREAGLNPPSGKYKSLIELNEEEMSKLVTAIMLRNPKTRNREIIGDIFLVKFFNKLEDARELSAIINACSRLGESELAVQFCMEIPESKKRAEYMHMKYRQLILSGLKFVYETEKIEGKGFVIINARDKIKDTMTGTIASILANSSIYPEGTIITTLAYYEDKIKVSIRSVGEPSRNLREILDLSIKEAGGNVGGHENAAGGMIKKEMEKDFIDSLKKNLEIELVKI